MKIIMNLRLLLTLLAILVLCVEPSAAQQPANDSDPALREFFRKAQQEKEEKLKAEPRIKKVHESLLELENIYNKDEKEAAKEFAKKHHLNVDEDFKAQVKIFLNIPAELFDDQLFESCGGKILWKEGGTVGALIPIDKIRVIVDTVNGISYIGVTGRGVPLTESEGVPKTGASAYHTAQPTAFTGQYTKIGVIDTGFGGLASAIAAGELPTGMQLIRCANFTCLPANFSNEPTATKDDVHGTAVAEIVYDMARSAQLKTRGY